MILTGDSLDKLKTLEENSIASVVTDPPYGLSFMGKKWDYDVPSVELWQEVFRVLKPGGHLLSFAGSRTYHRMAVNIEDAGFEIRDQIMWVYASGFPKSLNIGKAVDKLQGNEREVTGTEKIDVGMQGGSMHSGRSTNVVERSTTKGNSPYEGWGTALKPAHEDIVLARKPIESRTETEYNVSICQTLLAQTVALSSTLSPQEQSVVSSIAQWTAEKNINTLDDLSEVMAILQSCKTESMYLNIVLSWLNILAENLIMTSMSTTSTKSNTITELKILDSLEWANILKSITQAKKSKTDGLSADVYNAESLLNVVRLKSKDTLEHSASESATLSEKLKDLRPNHEPIVVARKPISEKSIAENTLKWGTGGINIDASRVGTTGAKTNSNGKRSMYGGNSLLESKTHNDTTTEHNYGRFPANLIHDGSDEVVGLFPDVKGQYGGKGRAANSKTGKYAWNNGKEEVNNKGATQGITDSGSSSRFFKVCKMVADDDFFMYNIGICGLTLENQKDVITLAGVRRVVENNTSVVEQFMSGKKPTENFLKDIVSTIRTTTKLMTDLKTYSASQSKTITTITQNSEKTIELLKGLKNEDVRSAENISRLITFKNEVQELIKDIAKSVAENNYGYGEKRTENGTTSTIDDTASRIKYQPKAGKSERNKGLEGFEEKEATTRMNASLERHESGREPTPRAEQSKNSNGHPTVKPIKLMQYLVKLVTPKDGTVLDPFNGSGTTGIAAKLEGFDYIGIELDPEYVKISEARIEAWETKPTLL